MSLSAISNASLTKSQVNQQKAENAAEQSTSKNPTSSHGGTSNGQDNVSLSQSDKTAAPTKVNATNDVETLLPRTMKAMLQDPSAAISTQANTSSEVAQEILANG